MHVHCIVWTAAYCLPVECKNMTKRLTRCMCKLTVLLRISNYILSQGICFFAFIYFMIFHLKTVGFVGRSYNCVHTKSTVFLSFYAKTFSLIQYTFKFFFLQNIAVGPKDLTLAKQKDLTDFLSRGLKFYHSECYILHVIPVSSKTITIFYWTVTLPLPCFSVQIKHKMCKSMNSVQ